jgi:hypothetical protein
MLKNLLLYRLVVFNTCCAAASVYAYKLGYADRVFKDASFIPYGILALFLVGLISTFHRGYKVSTSINEFKARTSALTGALTPYGARQVVKLEIKQSHIYAISDWLIYAALIGTAIGILVMVGDPSATAEQQHAATSGGLNIALPATIMGFVFALWTSVNFQMLDTAVRIHILDVQG